MFTIKRFSRCAKYPLAMLMDEAKNFLIQHEKVETPDGVMEDICCRFMNADGDGRDFFLVGSSVTRLIVENDKGKTVVNVSVARTATKAFIEMPDGSTIVIDLHDPVELEPAEGSNVDA